MSRPGHLPGTHIPLTREEIRDVEFDWFAADREGQLAQFLAAGDPTVPAAALASEEQLETLHVWLDTRPEAEPPNALAGGFDEHLTPPQRRGAYVYDALPDQPGHYRLVAAPCTPLTLDEVPGPLQEYLTTLTLPVRFGAARLWVGPDGEARVAEPAGA